MRKGKFTRRLSHIGSFLRPPVLISGITILVVYILSFIWWVIEQLAGDTVVAFVKPHVTQLFNWFSKVFPTYGSWIVTHPGSFSAILFFLILSVVTIKAYFETRAPVGLSPLLPFNPKLPSGNLIGAILHNNTGDDLINCRCHLHKVRILKNKKWVDAEYRLPQELHWRSELRDYIRDRIDIDSGNIGYVIVAAMDEDNKSAKFKVKEISENYFELQKGKYEAEIIFGGNRRDNSTITMNFWIEIDYNDIDLLSISDIYK